ncbi:hypothetical protein O181_093134 [Austropuccinia psidii MF-1]|uniref:Uncharacterized protein n=1 Tax=Austropuccinia psidii MF-1 TaxID=1389203 RepID=A0A9Q3J0V2_9BASI|nr:hypothetical protein [Austropuccinia psidii MF-1]
MEAQPFKSPQQLFGTESVLSRTLLLCSKPPCVVCTRLVIEAMHRPQFSQVIGGENYLAELEDMTKYLFSIAAFASRTSRCHDPLAVIIIIDIFFFLTILCINTLPRTRNCILPLSIWRGQDTFVPVSADVGLLRAFDEVNPSIIGVRWKRAPN